MSKSAQVSGGDDYGFLSRLLHHLALGLPAIAEMSFDVERALHGKKTADVSKGQHVFVAGLARAGTTILMRNLYGTGQFRSLQYRDMPFVLAPNLWGGIVRKDERTGEARERAHKDGIAVNADSPEALEEVFWRTFCGDDYLHQAHLSPMTANRETLELFREYIALLLVGTDAGTRYLSKNNNNILRLSSLAEVFPEAVILIPFRKPSQHAASLLRQHASFCKIQSQDPFTRKYMTWLAHHEFGNDHRPFLFPDADAAAATAQYPENDINYWMTLWMNTYEHLRKTAPENAWFICYEDLCGHDSVPWRALGELLRMPEQLIAADMREPKHHEVEGMDSALRDSATSLYHNLRERALGS